MAKLSDADAITSVPDVAVSGVAPVPVSDLCGSAGAMLADHFCENICTQTLGIREVFSPFKRGCPVNCGHFHILTWRFVSEHQHCSSLVS